MSPALEVAGPRRLELLSRIKAAIAGLERDDLDVEGLDEAIDVLEELRVEIRRGAMSAPTRRVP